MAEGWTRHIKGDAIDPRSAGVETHGLNQRAVKVMAEAGVDISNHKSKNVSELMNIDFDAVVTVCDHAREACPVFPKKTRKLHAGFDDPPRLAERVLGEDNKLDCYRKVRDEIKAFVSQLPDALYGPGAAR
ncbi:MAG: arsenate reductase [Spirochaetales bacterium]|nr:arsenate reductase [Spirochaetales bacterium]